MEKVVVDLCDDEELSEDEQLKCALELSKKIQGTNNPATSMESILDSFKLDGPDQVFWARSGCGESFFMNKIKGTSVAGNANCIEFQDLLEPKSQLTAALCTAYSVDPKWFLAQFPKTTPLTIVRHWDRNGDKEGHFVINERLTIVHPPLLAYSSMHAKLCLILFKTFIRVVVTSANLTEEDWTLMGQCSWYQDFPKVGKENKSQVAPFERDLMDFVSKLKLSASFLRDYDFLSAKVHLVASVSGYHTGKNIDQYGHMRLRSLLTSFEPPKDNVSEDCTYFQMSSIGGIDRGNWIDEFSASVRATGNTEHTNKKRKVDPKAAPQLHIVYPSKERVKKSSMLGAAMIFLSEEHYSSPTFPKQLLHDCISSNPLKESTLMHSKVLLRHIQTKDGESHGWCYIGSHNMSPSAWGRLQKGDTQFHTANYELGVLFVGVAPFQWLENVPFQFPPPKYTTTNGGPWILNH